MWFWKFVPARLFQTIYWIEEIQQCWFSWNLELCRAFKWKAVCDTEIPDRKATLPELSPAAPVFASPDENLIWWPTECPFGVGPRRQATCKAKSLMLAALLALSHLNERAYGIICLYFRVIKPRDEINAREGRIQFELCMCAGGAHVREAKLWRRAFATTAAAVDRPVASSLMVICRHLDEHQQQLVRGKYYSRAIVLIPYGGVRARVRFN